MREVTSALLVFALVIVGNLLTLTGLIVTAGKGCPPIYWYLSVPGWVMVGTAVYLTRERKR